MPSSKLVMYRTDAGHKPAFVVRGRKWLKVLTMDGGLKVSKVHKTEERHMEPLMRKGAPYVVSRAVSHFRKHGKAHGTTKTAQAILRAAV